MFENLNPALPSGAPEELLRTQYREDLDIWVCRWSGKQGFGHFQHCYNRIFNDAKGLSYHYWLIDIRSRGKASQQEYDWYFNSFLPAELPNLQGHYFIAYLVTPSHYSYIQEMETFTKFEDVESISSLKTRFFQSEQDAFDWLVLCRQKS